VLFPIFVSCLRVGFDVILRRDKVKPSISIIVHLTTRHLIYNTPYDFSLKRIFYIGTRSILIFKDIFQSCHLIYNTTIMINQNIMNQVQEELFILFENTTSQE
jgi:hypothetical protein